MQHERQEHRQEEARVEARVEASAEARAEAGRSLGGGGSAATVQHGFESRCAGGQGKAVPEAVRQAAKKKGLLELVFLGSPGEVGG